MNNTVITATSAYATKGTIQHTLKNLGCIVTENLSAGKNIYGGNLRIAIYMSPTKQYPKGLAIEPRWQSSHGTVDEKLPFLVENIKRHYPYPAIIILHGGGIRPGAETWCREQVDGVKLVGVYSLEEFFKWAKQSLQPNNNKPSNTKTSTRKRGR